MSWVTEDHGLPHLTMEAQKSFCSRSRVIGSIASEGLVHQHDRRVDGHRARHAHALLLPA